MRYRIIETSGKDHLLDTVSIVPGSFFLIKKNGDTLPERTYTINEWSANLSLVPDHNWEEDSLILATYRVFPYSFIQEYKDERLQHEKELIDQSEISYLYTYNDFREKSHSAFFDFGELDKSGSISRAISMGNNQDAVLNSTMNLQLSGELAPGVKIVAAITDNTIPIQPEGTSQQLREFDKVFIRAEADTWQVTAGDFEVQNGSGNFLRFNKKVQGAHFKTIYTAGKDNRWKMRTETAGAIARGKFAVNRFNGEEGSLGPYKLRGSNNESFIVVLAGTEKIYIDGKLMKRGANNDYIIDYNTAQLTFTPNRPITKDVRIVAEFEYAERSFNRSMFYLLQDASTENLSIQLQYFTEQDIKSQPVNQEQLLKDNIDLLKEIGDDLASAVVPNVTKVPFNNSEVLYKLTDTVVGSIIYDSIFVYSVNPDSAKYRLGFAFVGEGNGNYRQTKSAANGKVFKWVAPNNGRPQGDHEPIIQLITPKRQQMLTLSSVYQPNKKLRLNLETAISSSNLNTFSDKDNDDNTGVAVTTGLYKRFDLHKNDTLKWLFETEALYRLVNHRFTAVERFKDVEYERDWNILEDVSSNEHYGKLSIKASRPMLMNVEYNFEPLIRDHNDYSFRHSGHINFEPSNWAFKNRSSLMISENEYLPSNFVRHTSSLSRKAGNWVFKISEEGEQNRQFVPDNDSLLISSFTFQRWQCEISRVDSLKRKAIFSIGQRYDNRPENNSFILGSRADEIRTGFSSSANPSHRIDINVGYRQLNIFDESIGKDKEESLLGRVEYNHRLFNGLIRGSVFYEFGSGLEYKREFTYLEVAPGQGVYTWIDYNGDSIKQLDEFEVAVFQDEANYIRIFTPTNEFERVYTMQYSQSLQIDPASIANRDKRFGEFISRFSNQGHYNIEQKSATTNMLKALDPYFPDMDDPHLQSLSVSLRNTLFYNRSSSKYSIDYTSAMNESKLMMVNGFESRSRVQHILRSRWNIIRNYILHFDVNRGASKRASGFFSANDYDIDIWSGAATIQYQPGTQYRISLKYQYSNKKNLLGHKGEHALLNRATAEFRYTRPSKGSLNCMLEYVSVDYNSTQQNSVAFEMLEGLRPGNNFQWTVGYQRILANNMQISLQYNGRKSETNPMIHVGTVQVRAFF